MVNQIDCIQKSDRDDPTDAIDYVGGKNSDGTRWKITQRDAIRRIEQGINQFYVSRNGIRTDVIVAVSRFGNKYIKTKADGYEPNNLLSLVRCPI